jgi:hypothetical protein
MQQQTTDDVMGETVVLNRSNPAFPNCMFDATMGWYQDEGYSVERINWDDQTVVLTR